MESLSWNYNSPRAQKARISVLIKNTFRPFLKFMIAGLMLLGVAFLVLETPIGWTLFGLATIPFMYFQWYKYELKHIPSDKKSMSIDAKMSGDLLGQLPSSPSPHDLVVAISKLGSGNFLAARFGLTSNLLSQLASDYQHDMTPIWEKAVDVRREAGADRISAAIMAVAILRAHPDYQQILASIHLEDGDLIKGIQWNDYVRNLIQKQNQPRRTGGIARDWSFGYIPLLTRFGQNVSANSMGSLLRVQSASHVQALDQLVEMFGTGGRQNAVLVGENGTGKTTLINAFADRLMDAATHLPESLKFRQVFILDSSSLLAAAPGRGELENLIMNILGEAFTAKNIILVLDNAQLFFEESVGAVDLSNVLQPILDAGRVRMILCMDEQRFLQISQRNSGLTNALNRINITPATADETMVIMQDQIIITEYQRRVTFMFQALKEAYRLSERYVHDVAMPGRAIKLLESAAGYSENGLVTINSVQQAIEKTMNVKVSVASESDDREKLLNLEQHIHERMINQSRAVSVISDALRRARAGVRNQERPIGTFLFLGPTGVGKTELAKAIADIYFDGEDRMIRLDLNEYVRAEDVSRLIADGADDPHSLTAQAMKQPFSVVLLDEIEKAHPQVVNTLLQLLDEGILRDVKNREISFRDTIVIATSNAGADRIREYIERGWALEQFEKKFIDELISSNQFRPEFLNRFDEIVVFRPLNKPELMQVIDLILKGVNKTLSQQKISVVVDDDAKSFLVDKGYDPRLGARPMRRVVQRAVENTVAKQMLSGTVAPGSEIHIDLAQVQQILGTEPQIEPVIEDPNQLI